VANYPQALDLITDNLGESFCWTIRSEEEKGRLTTCLFLIADDEVQDEMRGSLDVQARLLYGLIHARWIVTARGLTKMVRLSYLPSYLTPTN
jgi:hypothetical protein